MKKNLRLAALATCLTSSILANNSFATESEEKTTTLNTITVTATRSPQKSFDIPGMVTVVESDDASIAGSATMKNLLVNVPSLEFDGSARRNGQNIVMRGFGTDGIVILFDGVRQKFESAHDGKFFIDPLLLKTVEVVRGPSSALYGSGGLGGVISMTTKDAEDLLKSGQKVGAMLTVGYQSVNDEFTKSVSGYGKDGNFDFVANVLTRDSKDIKLGNDTKLASQDDILSGMLKAGWSFAKNQKLKFAVQSYKNDAKEPNNPQSSSNSDLVNKNTESNTARIEYEYNDPNNKLVNLKTQLYHTNSFVDEVLLADTGNNKIGDKISRTLDTTGILIENQSRVGDKSDKFYNIFTYGINAYNEEQNGKDSANGEVGGIPDAKSRFLGFYLQDEINIKPGIIPGEFLIVPAARFDQYNSSNQKGDKIDANKVSPKFGVTYKPNDWLMTFGNYSKAFRAPNMTEIFTTGTHFSIAGLGSNVFVPNTSLRPETSETKEFGLGMKFEDLLEEGDLLQFKASRFNAVSRDFIDISVDFVMDFSSYPFKCCGTTTSVNIPKAKLWGSEFEGGYENKRFIFGFGYSYINGRNEETGEYLTNITPLTVKTNIGLKLPEIDSIIGVRSSFAKKHKHVNDESAMRDGYAVHNLYYQFHSKKYDNVTLNLGIDNIFDKAYSRVFAGSYETGRNYRMQVTYKW